MNQAIDLNFQPKTYFGPQTLEQQFLSEVKGALLRDKLKELFEQGRHDEVMNVLKDGGISEKDRDALEAMDSKFMGGNYLPNTERGEVEIARARLFNMMCDVTSVYARREASLIRYRVVDEHDGSTLEGPTEMESSEPLTLGELADFFLTAWPLTDVLAEGFEGDVQGTLAYFLVESDFYPDLDALCRQRVVEHLTAIHGKK